jgi:cytochrome c-type biogenesis protein CcmH/NrfG
MVIGSSTSAQNQANKMYKMCMEARGYILKDKDAIYQHEVYQPEGQPGDYKVDQRVDWCRKWTESDPNNDSAWYCLGVAYNDLKRYDDAIEAFRQAIRIRPKNADAWYALGNAYNISGNHTDALEAVRELRPLDPQKADKLIFNLIVP